MALTARMKYDYVELINKRLDIPVKSIEEFDAMQEALSNILAPNARYLTPEVLQEQILDICDLLNSPQDYVISVDDYPEYQKIIHSRIEEPVKMFQSFSHEEKLAYIQNQKKNREEDHANAAAYQALVAERQPPQPGSEAHTITEEQWLAEQQANFFRPAIQSLPRPNSDAEITYRILTSSPPARLVALEILRQAEAALLPPVPGLDLVGQELTRLGLRDNIRIRIPPRLSLNDDPVLQAFGYQPGFFDQRQQNSPQEDVEEAQLRSLNAAIRDNPDDLEARLGRAQLLAPAFRSSSFVMGDFNYILEREQNNLAALLGRASFNENRLVLNGNERYDANQEALRDYRHVLEIEPQNQAALDGVERLAPPAARPNNNRQILTEAELVTQIQNLFAADSDRVNIVEATENITDQIYEVVGSSNTRFANWGLIHFLDHLLANNPNIDSLLELSLALKISYLDETSIQQQISDAVTLSDRLFTEDDLRDVNTECLYEITAPNTLRALRDGRTTIDLLTQLDVIELRNAKATNEYPAPPQPNL